MRKNIANCIGAGALAVGSIDWIHHSAFMFDFEKDVTLEGVVKEFQYTNPRAGLAIQ